MMLVGIIPYVGLVVPLVDAVMASRKDQDCLHDLIAGTQVVKVFPDEAISSVGNPQRPPLAG